MSKHTKTDEERRLESKKKKVTRNLRDQESKEFWTGVKEDASAVRELPDWKRAGVSSKRTLTLESTPRTDTPQVLARMLFSKDGKVNAYTMLMTMAEYKALEFVLKMDGRLIHLEKEAFVPHDEQN